VRRRLLNLLTVLSMLPFLAAVTPWCRSYISSAGRVGERWRYDASSRRYYLSSCAGTLELQILGGHPMPNGGWQAPPGQAWDSAWLTRKTALLGFSYSRERSTNPRAAYLRIYQVPYWSLAVATVAAPTLWTLGAVRGRQLHRRRPLGLCPHCAYDLRATPGRCPECGREPSSVDKLAQGG
jgi:hypothetical protein